MRLRRIGVLPNLITVANGICGFAALVKLLKVQIVTTPGAPANFDNPELILTAAWLIIFGMLFDVFDGRVARMTGNTSDFGAQLDSFCDLVTFGLVPALLVVRLNMVYSTVWGKWVWLFCLLYFIGAMLRLARFNCENEHGESTHLCFQGLPSPAAAGCVASLVIFYYYIANFDSTELQIFAAYKENFTAAVAWIPLALPLLASVLGYTMISNRLKFEHVASRLFNRSHSFDFVATLIFALIIAAVIPEVLLVIFFLGYLVYTPCLYVVGLLRSRSTRIEPDADSLANGNPPGAAPSRFSIDPETPGEESPSSESKFKGDL